MTTTTIINEAAEAIATAAGTAPMNVDKHMHCISRLASEMGLTLEEVTPTLFVARDLEEGGQKFDCWLYSKLGKDGIGQTVTGVVLK